MAEGGVLLCLLADAARCYESLIYETANNLCISTRNGTRGICIAQLHSGNIVAVRSQLEQRVIRRATFLLTVFLPIQKSLPMSVCETYILKMLRSRESAVSSISVNRVNLVLHTKTTTRDSPVQALCPETSFITSFEMLIKFRNPVHINNQEPSLTDRSPFFS